MIAVEQIAQTMWREDVASRSLDMTLDEIGYACNTHNQRAVSASCSIDYLTPAFIDDVLTAQAAEVLRSGRRGIYDVKVVNQKGETVALFRGHCATVKGKWIE